MNRDLKNYPITVGLLVVIFIVYCYTTIRYGFDMTAQQGIEAGGFNPVYVIYYHEYYRLITANFIHFGIIHILCNAYSLYNLGFLMEHLLKSHKYIIVIAVSMLSTTLLGLVMYKVNGSGMYTIVGGISGVIFGLIGSLCALAYVHKGFYLHLFKQISFSVLLMLGLSVTVPSISLVGHLGGMIGGFVATIILEKIDY